MSLRTDQHNGPNQPWAIDEKRQEDQWKRYRSD
jgi:hypothetical protein